MALEFAHHGWTLPFLRRRRKVRSLSQSRRRVLFFNLILGLCLSGMALLHVWVRLQVVHLGYVLSTASKVRGHLEQANRELKLELATLTSPERLQRVAKQRLRLVEPEKDQVVILR
jgi:cell division protein FtsL